MEHTTTTLKEETVALSSRVWVSAADGFCGLMQAIVGGGALTYYFTRVRGLDATQAALVWILFGIWNAVNDPLFGYISDRTRSKLGRRIPYIRFGAPIIALAFILLWVDFPGLETQTVLFIQLLLGLFLYDTLYTAIATSIYIMPYEMAVSNKARSSIFVWKIIFMAFSTALPLVVLPIIQPGPGDDAANFRLIMTLLGVFAGLIIFFSTFFYQEKHFQQEEEQFPLLKSFAECFKNRSFIIFEVLSFTVMYVQTSLMQGILYYFDEIKLPGLPMYLALFAGIISGIFLWIYRRDAWGVKKCLQIWCALFGAGALLLTLFGRVLPVSVFGFLLLGFGFSGGMYLIPIMNGDVIDMDEHLTGLRREGMYAGVNSFITKPAISLAQAAFLQIIGWFGYNQTLAKGLQSTSAQTGILIGWALVPAILFAICLAAMRWYPLDGKFWEDIKHSLTREHQIKEKEYLEKHGYRFVEQIQEV